MITIAGPGVANGRAVWTDQSDHSDRTDQTVRPVRRSQEDQRHRVRIVGIGGSTREGSKTLIVLKTALRLAEEAGAVTVLADVREMDLPIFDDDKPLSAYPPILSELVAEARIADAFLLASPTYHGTITGAVKNVLDALNFLSDDTPPYFAGKPVGLLALGGPGAVNTVNALYHSVRGLNGLSVPTTAAVPGGAVNPNAGPDGDVTDPGPRGRVAAVVNEVMDLASRLRRPITVPLEEWDRSVAGR